MTNAHLTKATWCIMMMHKLEVPMVRTQIYLTQQERAGLASLAKTSGMKLSELVRSAINSLLEHSSQSNRDAVLQATAGLWKDRDDLPDFTVTRTGWDRSKA